MIAVRRVEDLFGRKFFAIGGGGLSCAVAEEGGGCGGIGWGVAVRGVRFPRA